MGATRTKNAMAFIVNRGGGVLEIIPCNDVGNDEMQEFFDESGGLTTVAYTQDDAGRDGYKETDRQPYKTLIATNS